MARVLPLLALFLGLLFQVPAFASERPELAEALSSARVGAGQVITDGSGQPLFDAQGQPLRVTSISTSPISQTAASLASVLRLPVADLMAYAQRLGMSLPIVMTGTLTEVHRSDGGIEQVFVFRAGASEFAFMADKTGENVFGVRMAHVDATGYGRLMTAHGLNGNFTHAPWYLSEAAKRDYWIHWGEAQVLAPAIRQASSQHGIGSLSKASGRSGIRLGDQVVLDRGQRAILSGIR